jgi:pimeloyl-ACP methyl ester carboxylesterase
MPLLKITSYENIHYLDENPSGNPKIVLLHGLGVNCNSWQMQMRILTQENLRVLAPDIPGFGLSTYQNGETSVQKMAASIANLLEALCVDLVHVVGISMGGTIALQLALDNPNLIDKLILANTFARLPNLDPRLWPYFVLRVLLVHTIGIKTQGKIVAKRIFPHSGQDELRRMVVEQISQADPKGYRATMHALARFNVEERLCNINHKTLVITGANDTTVPPKHQRILVDKIPNSRQLIIPQAGHAVSVENPDSFNKAIVNFIMDQ